MTRAYVLIKTETGTSPDVQAKLQAAGIAQVDIVAGNYDLVATVEVDDATAVGKIVMSVIQRAPGVLETETLLRIG